MLHLLSGCSAIIGSATQRLADDLGSAILNSNDPAMVRDGAPAFLILIDSMLNSNPNNPALLAQSAELLSSYAGAFVTEPERAKKMHNRAIPVSDDDRAKMVQSEDCGEVIRFLAQLPNHVCINDLTISPTWNRGYVASAKAQIPQPD